MNNLYILTNLLPKYHLGLDVIYHLSLVCHSNRGYLQILQNIQHHKKSNYIYYKNTILYELFKNNRLCSLEYAFNNINYKSIYCRNNKTIEYMRFTNTLIISRIVRGDILEIPRLYIHEYNDCVVVKS